MNEDQICKRLGISVSSLEKYKREHEELREAILNGRQDLAIELRSALKKRALGFTATDRKRTIRNVGGKQVTVIEEYDREVSPDVGAAHLLLKNIDSEWHNDDVTMVELKRRQQALAEKKHDDSQW